MSRLCFVAALCGATLTLSSSSFAHELYSLQSRAAAAHHHHYVEFAQQAQRLDDAIRLRNAEIASLELRLREWESLDGFQTGRALIVTIENTKLVLLQAKLELQRLEQQRFNLVRYRGRYRAW